MSQGLLLIGVLAFLAFLLFLVIWRHDVKKARKKDSSSRDAGTSLLICLIALVVAIAALPAGCYLQVHAESVEQEAHLLSEDDPLRAIELFQSAGRNSKAIFAIGEEQYARGNDEVAIRAFKLQEGNYRLKEVGKELAEKKEYERACKYLLACY